MEAIVGLYLEVKRKNKEEKHAVKLRVTYNRKQKYYSIKKHLTNNDWNYLDKDDFGKVMAKTQKGKFKDIRKNYDGIIQKANKLINDLNQFSFEGFETEYLGNKTDWNYLYKAFEYHIENLKKENRLGYASSFSATLTGIKYFAEGKKYPRGVQAKDHVNFKKYKNLQFIDITPNWLKKYETFLIENNKSTSTIGIHGRNLRVLFNLVIKEHGIKADYPFIKYEVKTASNKKRALTASQIAAIANADLLECSNESFYRDLFVFSFLANGMNLSDICRLKYSSISDNEICFIREKNKNKEVQKELSVTVTDRLKQIIKIHGNKAINKEVYIFPVLNADMDEATKYRKVTQLNKLVNKHLKKIAERVGIENPESISTYYARHSFATILKNSGASVEYLKESLGHSTSKTTENYLSSFESKERKKQADYLEGLINVG